MARVAPPMKDMRTFLLRTQVGRQSMRTDGYILTGSFHSPWRAKRVYERIDGKFVGVGWSIAYYRTNPHRKFEDGTRPEVQYTVILDSQLSQE